MSSGRWSRLRRLPNSERRILVRAMLGLPAARVTLRALGLAGTQRLLRRGWPRPVTAARPLAPETLSHLVDTAARHAVPPANCLHRSLVLWWLLGRQGTSADIRIGVRRLAGASTPDFHAWVEHDGLVLNDRPDIRAEFATFDRTVSPSLRRFR